MSAAQRRRLEALELRHGHSDWQRYFSTPINQWPEWALNAWLGEMTDEQLTAMIAELEANAAGDMSNVLASSQS